MAVLHDDRVRNYFQIDNVVVDHFLPRVGHTAFALYAYLARKADRAHVAWPSYTTMQRALGIGRNQVAESLKRLVDAGLISVEKGAKAAVNHYHINDLSGLAGKLVSPENQSRSETETSFEEKPKLVSQRDSIKTQLSKHNYQDPIDSLEGGINSPAQANARARERFSPAHCNLPDEEAGAVAAAVGTTVERLRGEIVPQWADRRLAEGRSRADWLPDLRAWARDYLKREATGGARASPAPYRSTAEKNFDGIAAYAERHGLTHGTHAEPPTVGSARAPGGHLPAGNPHGEPGRR